MSDEPTPSEVIGPDTLDQALLVVVVRADGTAVTFVSSTADRNSVADWMHTAADTVRAAAVDCDSCREGQDHTHPEA